MKYENILLSICSFLILSMNFSSCEALLHTTTIEVHVPAIPNEYVSKTQKHWTVYYIGEKNTIAHTTVALDGTVKIALQKMQSMPLLACVEYDGMELQAQQKNIGNTAFHCSLSAGAMAPYDVFENKTVLDFTAKSQTAKIMLFLYSRQVSTMFLNDRKLLSTIEKKSLHTPVDTLEIVQDIASNTLSYWSVKPKNNMTVSLSSHTMNLTSTSTQIPHITQNTKTISLFYPATWYFVNEHTATLYYVTVSAQKTVFSNLPIQLLSDE